MPVLQECGWVSNRYESLIDHTRDDVVFDDALKAVTKASSPLGDGCRQEIAQKGVGTINACTNPIKFQLPCRSHNWEATAQAQQMQGVGLRDPRHWQ